jgi:hypothetical protein
LVSGNIALNIHSACDVRRSERLIMPKIPSILSQRRMRATSAVAAVALVAVLAVWGGSAISAQDKYTVKVPNGLAFSEFKGFENWATVSVSRTGDTIEVILANPEMIKAYKAGAYGTGKHFADGAKMAKIHWNVKQSTEAPSPTTVPDTLNNIDFMVRDSKRFADTGAWGYAQFNYDSASSTFSPMGTGHNCGFACHTIVKAKDYVFTSYGPR